jgi:hypothetical protein
MPSQNEARTQSEALNRKSQIRKKLKGPNPNEQNEQNSSGVLDFRSWSLEFIWDFEFPI